MRIFMLGLLALCAAGSWAEDAKIEICGDWEIRVQAGAGSAELDVEPPGEIAIKGEKLGVLPELSANMPPWGKGRKLAAVFASECSFSGALKADSLRVYGPDGTVFAAGKDYQPENFWGCVARLPGGAIKADTQVSADYRCGTMRLDAVALEADGKAVLRKGAPKVGRPQPAALQPGERRLANIWVTPQTAKLADSNIFTIMESEYPEPPQASPSVAERLLPKTYAKLKAGGRVTILAWGDSVTACGFLPDGDRWQAQFAARLRKRYPKAQIELITEAWGGRNTTAYRAEPPGSVHNYKEKVLARKPDLIIEEFVNDAYMGQAEVDKWYGMARDEFKAAGIEWALLTPHYVRTDWMGLSSEKNIDSDPRPYVAALRRFAAANGIALADASLRWGRLWRRGIPYSTLLVNNINHPDAFGMSLFADSLMALFPEK